MRLYILLTVVCASVLSEITNDAESRLVLIKSGLVRGYKEPQEDVYVFYGIPYAKAPTGTQRFKAPLPPPTWMDTLEAVKKSIVCPQIQALSFYSESKDMKEDCLIANVYVPDTENKDLPVVVYVHGGGFIAGFGDLVTPKNLVKSKKIIAVTFNYRLGAHGFLCLGTEDIPGNAGMKDQVALLRWVKKNIASFGGNPNDVTIAGYSAGSSSVDLLMISKMAKGLFHKVIPESGASTSPYSIQVDPIKNAKEYAKLIDINDRQIEDVFELEHYFKGLSYDFLQSGNVIHRQDSTFLFAPCVERDNGQEIFLEDSPVNILKQGNIPKLPMLYGFANMEGLLRITVFDIWKKEMNENFETFLPSDLYFKTKEESDLAVNMIKEFYFGDKPVDDNTIIQYVDYMSDIMFRCPTLRNINHLVKSGHDQIFLYEYSYTDENTPLVPKTEVRGANHCAQTNAVLDEFAHISHEYSITDDYVKMKTIMRELWLNFIINGKPTASETPAWLPVGENWSPHMALKKNPELRGSLLKENCLFWDKIYDLYYKFPMPPSHPISIHNELYSNKSGFVRGYKDPEEKVFIFRGVPYAKAPSGTQRFKAPLPPPVWSDILEATGNGIICPQIKVPEFVAESKEMREDCLIVNIYVPATAEKNLPVVVYIHGGGFIFGFGDLETPRKIVSSKNIIAITFNYRLGAHGFLCLGTEDIPGNAGMKDQVALLRWVKENIASFGGNPNDVTISGYSAGSSSVNLLVISKMAEGLFSKVIPESGASLSPYSIQTDPIQNAKEYAQLIEIYNEDDIYRLENDFKEISYEVLQSGNILGRKDATFLFAPCVEQDNGQEIFLNDNPVNILRQGNYSKLPMLYGFANMEGLMRMPNFDLWKKEMNENFALFLPADLHFKNKKEKMTTVTAIRKFYFGNKPVDNNSVLKYVDYMSDVLFTCPTLREVNYLLEAGHNEIFLYEYSFTDENTPVVPNTDVRGAEHCAQTNAVLDGFNILLSKEYSVSSDYLKMKSMMRELWANFIIKGKPTASGVPQWKHVHKNWSPHMALKKNPELRGSLLRKRCMFWDEIYDLYYKFPMPPSIIPSKHRKP